MTIALCISGGVALVGIITYLSWLPRRNANKIDCVEGDIGKIQIHIARIDEKQTAIKENVAKMDKKLDKLLKLNGG